MLIPAIKYREQLNEKFVDLLYSEEMYCFSGCNRSEPYEVCRAESDVMYPIYEYAIINKSNELVGYVKYCIDISTDAASIMGVISFSENDLTVAIDVYKLFKQLTEHRRLEWKAIEGCKAIQAYISLCKKYKGMYFRHYDVFKDASGNFRDSYEFEILKYTTGREKGELA